MGAMTPFTFEGIPVRVVEIDGEAWFVGKDVAERLGYSDPTTAIRSHCRGVQKLHPIPDALGRTQEVRILSEPDVLRLIVKSSLPAAERFEAWVFEEVLPTIRKTGSYGAMPALPDLSDPVVLVQLLTEHATKRIEAEKRADKAEAAVEEAKPKTTFYDQFVNADGLYGLQNAARALGCHPNLFTRWLKQKYTFYQGGVPMARVQYIQMGLFEVKSTIVDDKARPRTYVTPKGLEYFSTRVPPEIKAGPAGKAA